MGGVSSLYKVCMCYYRALGYQKGDPGEWSHKHSMALGVVMTAKRGTVLLFIDWLEDAFCSEH